MSFQLFTLPAAAGCPQCPSPRCASSTTSWACPSGLTPLNAQWFQLVLLYLVGVLHQQPTEPVLQLLTPLKDQWFQLVLLSFSFDSSQRPVVPACALYLVGYFSGLRRINSGLTWLSAARLCLLLFLRQWHALILISGPGKVSMPCCTDLH